LRERSGTTHHAAPATPKLSAGKTVKKEEVLSISSSDRPKLADAYTAAQPLIKSLPTTLEPLPTLSALLQQLPNYPKETVKKKGSSPPRPATAASAQVPPERPRSSPGQPRARWNCFPKRSTAAATPKLPAGKTVKKEEVLFYLVQRPRRARRRLQSVPSPLQDRRERGGTAPRKEHASPATPAAA
jgi:hypothetical protein